MIEPINAIKPADIHALYTSIEDFDKLPDNKAFLFELWITKTKEYDTVKLSDVLDKLAILKAGKNHLDFDGVDVWMIKATKQQLCRITAIYRLYRRSASLSSAIDTYKKSERKSRVE